MSKDVIFFSHGNGFPSPCYRKFLHALSDDHTVDFIDSVGHNPAYPVTENWDHLVSELIANISERYTTPVIGVGHSLGGILNFRAAIQRPDLFKAVILLDSPIFGAVRSFKLRLIKWLGLIDTYTPAKRTRFRRQHWPSREVALKDLASKQVFRRFDEDCLNDYITYGMDHTEEGLRLRFNPRVEYNIYRTLPHSLPQYYGKLDVPAGLILGSDSHLVTRPELKRMQKSLNLTIATSPGGHMFPLEQPELAANAVKKIAKQLLLRP